MSLSHGPSSPVEEGDRYLTQLACSPSCTRNCFTTTQRACRDMLAVQPYSFIFRAPVKGRWIGRSLLEVFVKEFAHVPSAAAAASAAEAVCNSSTAISSNTHSNSGYANRDLSAFDEAVSFDHRVTLPRYIDELCTGELWLHGREAECRAAGELYRCALIRWVHSRTRLECTSNRFAAAAAAAATSELVASEAGEVASASDAAQCWLAVKRALCTCFTQSDVDEALMKHAASSSPPVSEKHAQQEQLQHHDDGEQGNRILPLLLTLRQKDIVLHRVWRREGYMFAHEPIHILRCMLPSSQTCSSRSHVACGANSAYATPSSAADASLRGASEEQQQHTPSPAPTHHQAVQTTDCSELAMLVCSKPASLPVHPSGCYRKNSVTSVLEDVFGGCDSHRYACVEPAAVAESVEAATAGKGYEVAIVHRRYRFELIRVHVGADAVPHAVWTHLRRMMRTTTTATNTTTTAAAAASASASVASARSREESLATASSTADSTAKPSDAASALPSASTISATPSMGNEMVLLARGTDTHATHTDGMHANPPPASHRRACRMPEPWTRGYASLQLKVFVVHRLDAATSGVLIFGLDKSSARVLAGAIAHKEASPPGTPIARTRTRTRTPDQSTHSDVRTATHTGRGSHIRSETSNHHDGCADSSAPRRNRAHNGGVNTDYWDAIGRANDRDESVDTSPVAHCVKEYLALVHGCLDVRALAAHAHGCHLEQETPIRSSSSGDSSAHATPDSDSGVHLWVNRPIGCLSPQRGMYWCPEASQTAHERCGRLRQHETSGSDGYGDGGDARAGAEAQHNDAAGGGARTGERSKKNLAEKHARMRRQARGRAAAPPPPPPSSSSSSSYSPSVSAARLEEQFMQSLRTARTRLGVLKYDPRSNRTLLRCWLYTGRTHQIRVHLASLGHPIVGDVTYVALSAAAEQCRNATARMGPRAAAHDDAHGAQACEDSVVHAFYREWCSRYDRCAAERDEQSADVRGTGCVGVARICLHAWRYTLCGMPHATPGLAGASGNDSGTIVLESPTPGWVAFCEA